MNNNIGASYEVNPDQLFDGLVALFEARQNVMVWGAPGVAKSAVSSQVAKHTGRNYVDIRATTLDPVDIRGLPYIDADKYMATAIPRFLPPTDSTEAWLINFEELPAATQLVQVALYQLLNERAIGEYKLPEKAVLMGCGNRVSDAAVSSRMGSALASRFFHFDAKSDVTQWLGWAANNGIAPEVMFFMHYRSDLFHKFDPKEWRASAEHTFPCPRTWEKASTFINTRPQLDPEVERAIYRGVVGEEAAVAFCSFLKVWRSLPHPRVILDSPDTAPIPDNPTALIALCGGLYRLADDTNMDAIVTYASRGDVRREVGEFLVGRCTARDPNLCHTSAHIRWASTVSQ